MTDSAIIGLPFKVIQIDRTLWTIYRVPQHWTLPPLSAMKRRPFAAAMPCQTGGDCKRYWFNVFPSAEEAAVRAIDSHPENLRAVQETRNQNQATSSRALPGDVRATR